MVCPMNSVTRTSTGGTGCDDLRTSPVNVVDPTELADDERDHLGHVAEDAARTGTIDLATLPESVRDQLRFALDAYSRGETVAAVANGKPLTSNEAAKLLGMSRAHLARLCGEGRVESFTVGNALRISADEVMRILTERGRARAAVDPPVQAVRLPSKIVALGSQPCDLRLRAWASPGSDMPTFYRKEGRPGVTLVR